MVRGIPAEMPAALERMTLLSCPTGPSWERCGCPWPGEGVGVCVVSHICLFYPLARDLGQTTDGGFLFPEEKMHLPGRYLQQGSGVMIWVWR